MVAGLWLVGWVAWGAWPGPELRDLAWRPDAIVVLGGGNEERPREALRLSERFPEVPVIVTGDSGTIRDALISAGLSPARIVHETAATSTVENARFTAPLLDRLDARRVVLVTNWFHVPRSLAVFGRHHPGREFAAAFEPKPAELNGWHRHVSRRERLAAVHYVVRHGVWSFGG